MRLYQIKGDEVVFLYDHNQEDVPRVGDSYYLRQVGSEDALVVQIVSLETFDYPSLGEALMRQVMEESYGAERVQTFAGPSNAPQIENLGRASGKIQRRRKTTGDWGIWNGWVPSRNVDIKRVEDEELFTRCGLSNLAFPLKIGSTLDGREFAIEGRSFEKINVITAVKGMGKSHLAKVLVLQLIEQGMVCVVFDQNQEYLGLPRLKMGDGEDVICPGIIILSASQNLRISIEEFGRRALIHLFEGFNPGESTRNTFDLMVNTAFDQLEQLDDQNRSAPEGRVRARPFFNPEYFRSQVPHDTHEFVSRAILARLEQIEGLNLFAETSEEGESFIQAYERCAKQGGALIVDLAPLTSGFAREIFVGATLDMVERAAGTSQKLPFVFFEEAHLYTSGERISNLVARARHLGVTSTFVTNMVTQLNETVLRQVDNLFLLNLPHKDDVRHVAKSATTDEETVSAFAQRIEMYHAMVVGKATGHYPIVFKVATPHCVNMAGETRYAFSRITSGHRKRFETGGSKSHGSRVPHRV